MRQYYCTPILYKTLKNIGNVKMSKTCVSNRINKTPKCLEKILQHIPIQNTKEAF